MSSIRELVREKSDAGRDDVGARAGNIIARNYLRANLNLIKFNTNSALILSFLWDWVFLGVPPNYKSL